MPWKPSVSVPCSTGMSLAKPSMFAIPFPGSSLSTNLHPTCAAALVQIEDLTPLPSEEDPTDWKWEGYRLFEDRAGNRIATYTSTYARYAASEIPKGPVTLVGVLQYGNAGSIGKSYMIKMRDENDCFR